MPCSLSGNCPIYLAVYGPPESFCTEPILSCNPKWKCYALDDFKKGLTERRVGASESGLESLRALPLGCKILDGMNKGST